MTHPVHEFAQGRAGLNGQRVTGMPQIVKVNIGQSGGVERLAPWENEFCVLQTEFPELLAQRKPWRD